MSAIAGIGSDRLIEDSSTKPCRRAAGFGIPPLRARLNANREDTFCNAGADLPSSSWHLQRPDDFNQLQTTDLGIILVRPDRDLLAKSSYRDDRSENETRLARATIQLNARPLIWTRAFSANLQRPAILCFLCRRLSLRSQRWSCGARGAKLSIRLNGATDPSSSPTA
jgi:hypothetical protein